MRTRKVIALVVTIVLLGPATAAAQDRTDERVRQDAAALPERLWEPGPDPVSAAGPTLTEDGGGVAPLVALMLLAVAAGAGYAVSMLRGAPGREAELVAPRSRRFVRRGSGAALARRRHR